MKKKTSRKLSIKKSTISVLQPDETVVIKGGTGPLGSTPRDSCRIVCPILY